jgi:hypothetical protein
MYVGRLQRYKRCLHLFCTAYWFPVPSFFGVLCYNICLEFHKVHMEVYFIPVTRRMAWVMWINIYITQRAFSMNLSSHSECHVTLRFFI